jgi:hypothetical protein
MRLLILFLLLTPTLAFANTVAPLLPLLSAWSTMILPLIFVLEALHYKRSKIPSPYKLSFQTNLISSLVGLVLWFAIGLLIFVPYESPSNIRFWMARQPNKDFSQTIQTMIYLPYIFLIPNCFVSAWIEYLSAKKLKTWKNTNLSFKTFLKASLISYFAIALFLFFFGIKTMEFVKML